MPVPSTIHNGTNTTLQFHDTVPSNLNEMKSGIMNKRDANIIKNQHTKHANPIINALEAKIIVINFACLSKIIVISNKRKVAQEYFTFAL
jgi:multisubunit Na+/H+ antiporter MnhC subunit